jgi:hypothetical protein
MNAAAEELGQRLEAAAASGEEVELFRWVRLGLAGWGATGSS